MGPAGPEGPMGPQGLEGPMGLQGPMGPMGLQGMEGPMGPQGPQGIPGPMGPMGPAGPAGSAGITFPLNGPVGWIPNADGAFQFVGPIINIYLGNVSTISGMMQAPLGTTAAADSPFPLEISYDLCFQMLDDDSTTLYTFSGMSPVGELSTRPVSWMAAGTVTLPPGSYYLGFCVQNHSSEVIDRFSSVTGFLQLTEHSSH